MKLEPLLTFTATIGSNLPVGNGPYGNRAIAEVTGGRFEGPRLRGRVLPPGADWVLVDATGHGRVDVRVLFQTDDGANIYVTYTGVLELNEAAGRALAGGPETQFGDSYFVTQLRFETGASGYAWLNHVVAVGEGRLMPGQVQYRVHHCVPG
ncbi:MAG: DUF3237 domain-containing protein [Pseudomonadales bacterium]